MKKELINATFAVIISRLEFVLESKGSPQNDDEMGVIAGIRESIDATKDVQANLQPFIDEA